MPIHDWSRVDAGIFHDFHQAWTIGIRDALNGGLLPADFFALTDQVIGGLEPDVITLSRDRVRSQHQPHSGGTAVADAPPRARFITSAHGDIYARKANRIKIQHTLGRVVAIIEVVSPGNKSSRYALTKFVEKAAGFIRLEINVLVVDLFPPTSRDPQGIHRAIWDAIEEEPFELPADKPLTVAAYSAAPPPMAYVEPVAVGDELPSLPIFLERGIYVPAPLESTYQLTWSKCPRPVRELIESYSITPVQPAK